MNGDITLHPGMTALQIAEWCERHHMYVRIDYSTGADGCLIAVIQARREEPVEHVPMFHRRQAD